MGNKALVPLELYTSGSNPTAPTPPEGAFYYNSTADEVRYYNGSAWVASVNTATAQTIGGAKVFQTTSGFPVTIDQYSTNGGPFLRVRDSSANVLFSVTLGGSAGSVAVGGESTGITGQLQINQSNGYLDLRGTQATSGVTTYGSPDLRFYGQYWNGVSTTLSSVILRANQAAAAANSTDLYVSGARNVHIYQGRLKVEGGTGVSTVTRWVGGTTGAAPASGTHEVGDFVVTTDAKIWVCTTAGTPGTWTQVGGGSVSYATTTELANVDNAAESAGASSLVARGDHKHAVNSATAVTLQGGAAGAGSSTSLALADHQHGAMFVGPNTSDTVEWNTVTSISRLSVNAINADGTNTTRATQINLIPKYWTGAASATNTMSLKATTTTGPVGTLTFFLDGADRATLTGAGLFTSTGGYSTSNDYGFQASVSGGTRYAGVKTSSTNTDPALYVGTDGGGYLFQVDNRGRVMYADGVDMTTKGGIIVGGTGGGRVKTVGGNGTVLTADSADARGVTWVENATPVVLSVQGQLSVATGVSRFGVEGNYTILGVRARVDTAPTGTSIKVDVNKNGTTIFSTQTNRPDIAVSTNASSYVTNMNTTTLASGDYLTIDVDQVGSTVAGSHLTVVVWLMRTS